MTEKFVYFTQILSKLTAIQQQQANRADFDNQIRYLNNIFEDIHWLLLISGFIIIDLDNDAECRIPGEIMNYSIRISALVDLNLTRNLFKEKLNSITITEVDLSYCDPICSLVILKYILFLFNLFLLSSLIYVMLQLCELETQMHPIKMIQYMSPQVAATLMWFLKEFSRSYLFMKENNYQEVNTILSRLLHSLARFIIDKSNTAAYFWPRD